LRRHLVLSMLITALCALLVLATTATAQSADSTQTVTSRVLDTNGQPVRDAQVVAEPMDSRFPTLRTTTNAAGEFTLTLVREVTYEITTSKEADGNSTFRGQTTYFRPRAAAVAPAAEPEPEAPAEEAPAPRRQEWFLLVD
jgi:hypothetical protein